VRIEVHFTPPEGYSTSLQESTAAVVDVVRATTSMVEALAHGARSLFPVVTAEDAVNLAASLGREDTLLCGERKGKKIEGFDLGNSPREYTPEVVGDKRLVWSTTNGTADRGSDRSGPRATQRTKSRSTQYSGTLRDALSRCFCGNFGRDLRGNSGRHRLDCSSATNGGHDCPNWYRYSHAGEGIFYGPLSDRREWNVR
jgi:hypothetical protein